MHRATLEGTVNPNGADTHYYFEYGTTSTLYEKYAPALPGSDVGGGTTTTAVSAALTKLAQNTTYYYRIVASSSSGTSYGEEQQFRTHSAWTIQSTVNPSGAPEGAKLAGVSCWAANACIAVGAYYNASTEVHYVTLVERWNGTSWEVQQSPNPAVARGSFLESVSCPSASECTAAGYYEDSQTNHHPVAERWNGEKWTVETPPSEGRSSGLTSVSCASASECVAVGSYVSGSPAKASSLVELWNGAEWKVQTSAKLPETDEGPAFSSVSCPAAKSCIAVGGVIEGLEGTRSLAESWNGTSWNNISPPRPPHSLEDRLGGVSCSSTSACTAVGHFKNTEALPGEPKNTELHGEEALVERWNGTGWQVQEAASPILNSNALAQSHWELSTVSCSSATSCLAIGSYGEDETGSSILLGELWEGTSWEVESPIDRVGIPLDQLGSISCTGPEVCTAVGQSWKALPSGPTETLAERLEEAPAVTTRPASALAQTTATLNASVNPNGLEVSSCKLEYGTTTAYGSSAPCTPAPGSGETPVAVSATVSGLAPSTTYHFRVSSSNAGGTSTGSDLTFTTPGFPSTESLDTFERSAENPLSNGGKWSKLGWTKTIGRVWSPTFGWVPKEGGSEAPESEADGAYWNVQEFTNPAVATHMFAETRRDYVGIWCDTTGTGSKNGYRLKVVGTATSGTPKFRLVLEKWVNGTRTQLGESPEVVFKASSENVVGLTAINGQIKGWYGASEASIAVEVEASDTTFSRGFVGIEGNDSTAFGETKYRAAQSA
jgi:hypothetical protein